MVDILHKVGIKTPSVDGVFDALTTTEGLAETEKIVAEYGLTQVVHPHVNTLIETAAEFQRFLENSSSLFCLDTGHLFIGDADPVAIAEQHGDRVGLVHVTPAGRERHYRIDDAQLARAVAQLSAVGAEWDGRLERIKRIAESIQRNKKT